MAEVPIIGQPTTEQLILHQLRILSGQIDLLVRLECQAVQKKDVKQRIEENDQRAAAARTAAIAEVEGKDA